MKYTTGSGFRQALETRIRAEASEARVSPARLRKLVAFDRLLARLLDVAPDRWIAKGGYALNLRFGDRARTTMDLDLARQGSHEAALEDLRLAAAQDVGDFFTFEILHVEDQDHLKERAERYRVLVSLGDGSLKICTLMLDLVIHSRTHLKTSPASISWPLPGYRGSWFRHYRWKSRSPKKSMRTL